MVGYQLGYRLQVHTNAVSNHDTIFSTSQQGQREKQTKAIISNTDVRFASA